MNLYLSNQGFLCDVHLHVAHFDAGGRIPGGHEHGCGDEAADAEGHGREEPEHVLRPHETRMHPCWWGSGCGEDVVDVCDLCFVAFVKLL